MEDNIENRYKNMYNKLLKENKHIHKIKSFVIVKPKNSYVVINTKNKTVDYLTLQEMAAVDYCLERFYD